MRVATKVLVGIVPACLMTLMGLAFAGLAVATHQRILIATAVLGTSGLMWSLIGYSRRTAGVVLALLSAGIIGVLIGGIFGAISALARDAHNDNLGSPFALAMRILLLGWLVLGPAAVGLVQARDAVQVLRAGA